MTPYPRCCQDAAVTARVYDLDTATYRRAGAGVFSWFMLGPTEREHVSRLLRMAAIELKRGEVVVDMGCGVGSSLRFIKDTFPGAACVGITNSRRQYDELVRAHENIRAVHADFNCVPLPPKVKLFVFLESFGHVLDARSALWRCASVLAPGGRVIIQDVLSLAGIALIPSWRYRVRTVEEVREAAVSVDLECDVILPAASSARGRLFFTRNPDMRERHGAGVGAAERCVVYRIYRKAERPSSVVLPYDSGGDGRCTSC